MATEGKKNKVLKIGNLELENPFLLAPLAGITDASDAENSERAGSGNDVFGNGVGKRTYVW